MPHLGSGQLGENLLALASCWPCHNLSATGKTRRLHKCSTHYHSTTISINTGMSSSVCLCPKSCGGGDSSVGPAWCIPNVCGVRGQERCGSPGMSSFAVHCVHQTAMERSSIHVSNWRWEGMKWNSVLTHENAIVKPITSCDNSVKLSCLLSQITYWIWVSETQIIGRLGVTQRSPYS